MYWLVQCIKLPCFGMECFRVLTRVMSRTAAPHEKHFTEKTKLLGNSAITSTLLTSVSTVSFAKCDNGEQLPPFLKPWHKFLPSFTYSPIRELFFPLSAADE